MPAELFKGLNAPQTVFCLFFAIFWGLVANAQVRWKAFDWPLAIVGRTNAKYKQSWSRIWRSLWYLTAVPVLLFIGLFTILAFVPERPFDWRVAIQVGFAVLAAHAVFAPYRFWLSTMECQPGEFYYQPAFRTDETTPPDPELWYAAQPWSRRELRLESVWSPKNRRVAWLYVAGSVVFALIALFGV